MDATFEFPIRRDTLHEQVADRIQGLIIDRSLRIGDKLPGERDLAEQVGVSRTVIREAIHVLRGRGLVEVKPGSGSYIRRLSLNDVAAPIGLLLKLRRVSDRYDDLHEIRGTLEVDIAGLAAKRATDEDIAGLAAKRATDEDIAVLESAIEGMAAHPERAKQFTRYDLAFHAALAAATHNDLYSVLLTPITDLLLEFRLTAYRHDADGSVEGALTYHRRILSMIKARDPEGARQAIREHLRQAWSLMEAAQQATVKS